MVAGLFFNTLTVFLRAVAGILIAFGAGMVIPLMGGWAYLKFGLADNITAPILGGVNSLVIGVANLVTPRLARKVGTVKTIVLTQASSTTFLFSLPFTQTFSIASAVFITRSTLMMMSNPTEQSLLMGLVSEDERSSASAITAALWRLPNSFSTAIGGFLMGLGGFYLALPFFLCTVLYLTSITYFRFAFKQVPLQRRSWSPPCRPPTREVSLLFWPAESGLAFSQRPLPLSPRPVSTVSGSCSVFSSLSC